MKRNTALVGLFASLASLASVPAASAAVVAGTAANVPAAEVSGATKALTTASNVTVGPLAAALQGRPVVVRIHADWCSACKATHATLADLRKAYAGRINYVEFNVTNAATAAKALTQARKLGLAQFYNVAKAQTSTVAVINPQDGKIYATFYNDGNLKDYQVAINHVLKTESE